MTPAERCAFLDADGCRCLLRSGHRGPHDPSYTAWAEIVELRKERRLEEIRGGGA